MEKDMDKKGLELIEYISENYNNKTVLNECLLHIHKIMFELAIQIASSERDLAESTASEYESSYNKNATQARLTAQRLVGGQITRHQYDFESYKELLKTITFRISQDLQE